MPPKSATKARRRPRTSVGPSATPASTGPSSVRRSTRKTHASSPYCASSTVRNQDDSDASLSSPDIMGEYSEQMNGKECKSHTFLSTITYSNDYNDSSEFSTPVTSADLMPLSSTMPPISRKRSPARLTTSTKSEIADIVTTKVATASNSCSAVQSTASNKRKREADSKGSEDDKNSIDAQEAFALQTKHTAFNELGTDVNDDMDKHGDENFNKPSDQSPLTKRVKVELSPQGSNTVCFSPWDKREVGAIMDSDESEYCPHNYVKGKGKQKEMVESIESDDFIAIEESENSDIPLIISSVRRRAKTVHTSTGNGKFSQRLTSSKEKSSGSAFDIGSISKMKPEAKEERTIASTPSSTILDSVSDVDLSSLERDLESEDSSEDDGPLATNRLRRPQISQPGNRRHNQLNDKRAMKERERLEKHHPELNTMWKNLENLPKIGNLSIEQPENITRELKPFQLQGVAWMKAMEETEWGGGLLGDEMGMGKTIQAVSLIMSDWPANQPSLVLIPPVALMQWQQEIEAYTNGKLKTLVFHGTNAKAKQIRVQDIMNYDVILISYNSLESMYRKQEKGFKRKAGLHREKSVIHQIRFHRVILDEAHNIKSRTSGCAKACFALQADHKWCLSGTPLQNRIGEFFSLVRFLDIRPFTCYFCKQCSCATLNWNMNDLNRCKSCNHNGMQHVSVFNQELLNPIQKYGNWGPGAEAFRKLRILTDRFMLRRIKRDHSSAMELPAKEIYVDRQFFGEEENDFAGSIMNNGTRKFETYVAQGVLLNNYANIFGLIMQMRQVADHPDLILKKKGDGGQNVLVCCICDETAEEAIRSTCRHDFCRECAKNYLKSSVNPDCPQCHIQLAIDLEQPDIEQDEEMVKKSSIINRIKMEKWTSSSKIEALVHDLYKLRSKNMSHKSIIFSQFTTMLQLVEWRLRRAGINTVMLDGSMTPAQRQASINHFMADVNVECFLVSLKAGGVALNLTEASHVFIVDPWWNPAAEWQSADRCHRIGQARPCSVTRLCIEDSVESRMVLLQEKKANMINSTINADDSAMESLTPEDMQFLFRGS